ncbi:hypothetical protein C8J56DRAFT_918480 [Mycena floridula]|nr:hypothetical protein C8J56DRAFT_918480 [Mycena floridula]
MTSKGLKRGLEDSVFSRQPKKIKPSEPSVLTEEVDFPRGGGTSFTPLEVKSIRAEGLKEANEELFQDSKNDGKSRKRKRKSEAAAPATQKMDKSRIEHLNYKRLQIGMKIFGQIVSILPLALVISLPNQLLGHVPITAISSEFTSLLEKMDVDEVDDDASISDASIPDLSDIFQLGQYVRAVVTAVHATGSTDTSGIGRAHDELIRASRRVELALNPERVNAGLAKTDLKSNFTLSAAVKSVEDHGYLLDLGLADVSGFLSFKDTKQKPSERFKNGQLLDVTVKALSGNGRTCEVLNDPRIISTASMSEVTNVASILPGALVQCLITAVQTAGLQVQVLGFFDGSIEQIHLRADASEKAYKVSKKVKARVLYNIGSVPPKFSLALTEHVINLEPRRFKGEKSMTSLSLQEAYPLGKILESVKVLRIEPERGVVVEVDPGVEGFAHISHMSDDHLPTIATSGPWKLNSLHRARITGYFHFDGILQLSLKPSVLEQKIFQLQDVQVGEVIKGSIKKLTDTGLFVTLSDNLVGAVWPNHYADITLKQPSKRFKIGANIKCRVLAMDSDRNRISLTAKKSLVDSTLPIITTFEDAKVGIVTHAVVVKILDKSLLIEFYNHLKAAVPLKEVSESPVILTEAFSIGKVIQVRIISVDPEQRRLVASIRQASPTFSTFSSDISGVEISNIVDGVLQDIHADNVVLALEPSKIRALLSLKNLANHRGTSVAQLRAGLKIGEKIETLVVVTRNVEKGFVIVATKPEAKASSSKALTMDTVAVGQVVQGRVTRQIRHGSLLKLTGHIGGILHPTDTSDNFETGAPYPASDSIIKAVVTDIDVSKKQLTLSTRPSKMNPTQSQDIVDREITGIKDLQVGDNIRGFIKSVMDHGVFVTIGREVDARVQIRELFDDYVKEWKGRFETHQLVKGRILSIDPESKKVEMTFRSGQSSKASKSMSAADLKKGQKIQGLVKKIESFGLFIQINGSKLSGLCHKSELSDNTEADLDVALRGFREGDRVKAVVLDVQQRRISLSLKPSHFNDEDFEDDEDQPAADVSEDQLGVIDDDDEEDVAGQESEADSEDDPADYMQVDVDSTPYQAAATPAPFKSTTASHAALKLPAGFQWSAEDAQIELNDASSSDEEDEEQPRDKKKRRKKKEIEQDLTADMHTKKPESNADFERVLLGSPNSSYLWIQYMSFQLQLSEIDKAREIAQRALQTIHFREEQEKLNVWIALLNLECAYGSEDSLDAVFKSAARANDSKTVHLRMASIFEQAEKIEKAEEQYNRTCKKFGLSSKVWTLFSEHYLRRGNIEDSRKLLPRSLQSLDKRKHLKTISRFAQLEYKLGEPERGKTLFEGIVESHPKRWDLWTVYMDMEASQENIQSLRDIFDRVFAIKMTSHKAKSFFKKWLELEKRLGDEESQTVVKQKAVEWTQRANASS